MSVPVTRQEFRCPLCGSTFALSVVWEVRATRTLPGVTELHAIGRSSQPQHVCPEPERRASWV